MKQLAGSILLILPLVFNGCGNPNPVGSSGPAAPKLSQQEIDERHAANFLSAAKAHRQEGQSEQAERVLLELVEKYPESEAAEEAAKMLKEFENESTGDVSPLAANLRTARGLLKHHPQDVKSEEAWLGNEFMIGETPIRPTTKVPHDTLMEMVGKNVEVKGVWNPGEKWEPAKPGDEEFLLQTPSYPEGMTVIRGSGIEVASIKKVNQ